MDNTYLHDVIEVGTYEEIDLASELFQAPAVEVRDERWAVALNTMQIQPAVQNLPAVPSQHLRERHRKIMRITYEENLPIRFVGYAPTFEGTRIYEGPTHDWVMMNLDEDPQYLKLGKTQYAPSRVIAQLTKMRDCGFEADHIYIAHEVQKGSIKQGQEIPLEAILPPPPARVARRVSGYADKADRVWKILTAGLVGLAGAAMSLATLPLGLDPVLFGVLTDHSIKTKYGEFAMWYYLTHWLWETEE